MQRISLAADTCSMGRSLSVLGHWWTLLIVREAFAGSTRFEQFQRRLGISRNSLSDRLRALVEAGILERCSIAEGRAREEYRLTEMGDDLLPVVVALRQWGDRWLPGEGTAQERLVDAATGEVLPPLEVRSRSGRALGRGDIQLAMRST